MNTYLLLKTGEILIVYSDNIEEETYNAYPISKEGDFDVEVDVVDEIKYSDVLISDTNIEIINTKRRGLKNA